MYKKCWIKNMYQCIATKNMILKMCLSQPLKDTFHV